MWNPFKRKEKSLQQPSSRGWTPIFSHIMEPFAGAWQRNVEVDNKTVLSFHAIFLVSLLLLAIFQKCHRLCRPKIQTGFGKKLIIRVLIGSSISQTSFRTAFSF